MASGNQNWGMLVPWEMCLTHEVAWLEDPGFPSRIFHWRKTVCVCSMLEVMGVNHVYGGNAHP